MLPILLTIGLKLSAFCSSSKKDNSPVQIDEFDIPFDKCSISDFSNIEIQTTYSAIKNCLFRTLRLDNQLKLTINDVTSGDILTKLDILDSTVTLNISPSIPSSTIEGSFRINKINGAHLIINDGSFRVNPQKLIRFIHTNDVHCAYVENSGSGTIGLSKFVSYVKQQKKEAKEKGYSVFAVDCGDFNQGLPLCSVSNGTTGHDALKLAQYDAFTLGNHEWDYGHHNLYVHYKDFEKNKSPLIVANIEDNSEKEKMEFNPYIVKEISSFGTNAGDNFKLRVGIFGFDTPYTNVTTNPVEVKDVTFDPNIVSLSQKYVKILREDEKCDVIVLISHLGYEELELTSNKIAESFDGIDVIIDGHSHTTLDEGAIRLNNDYTTLIAQTGSSMKNIGVVDIIVDSITKKVVGKRASLLNYETISSMNLEDDTEMLNFLNTKEKEVEELTKVKVGKTLIDLDCLRQSIRVNGSSKMGFLASTAILSQAGDADIAFLNGGGIRSAISKGDVTWGDVISVLPFGNQVVLLNISGKRLHETLRYGTRLYKQQEFGGFPVTSGVSFTIDLSKNWESVDRITDLKIVGIDGKKSVPVVNDDAHFYKLVTSDFLYNGGDGYQTITNLPRLNQYSTELNAVLEFLKSLPDATVTGNEDFFAYTRINEVGTAPQIAKKLVSKKRSSSSIIHENTIEINDGVLNLLNSGINVDDFKSIFNYTVKAKSILASDVATIKELLGDNSENYAFAGHDGFYMAGNKDELLVGKSLNDNGRPITKMGKSCSFFSKLDGNGTCKADGGIIAVFVLMCAFVVAVIVLVVLLVVKSRRAGIGNSEHEEEPWINNIFEKKYSFFWIIATIKINVYDFTSFF